jgi:hypothetical protein
VLVFLQVILCLVVSYCILSFLEWYTHRYHMHRRGWLNRIRPWIFQNHQIVHHPAYRGDFHQANPISDGDIGIRIPAFQLALVAVILLTPLWFYYPLGAGVFVGCVLTHSLAWNVLHTIMHWSEGWKWGNVWWFRSFYRNHYFHHLYPNRNYNIICLGADHLLGTRAKPTAEDERQYQQVLAGPGGRLPHPPSCF